MRIAPWAARHARSILFLLAVLVAAGVVATLKLPAALFPRVNFPRIRINIEAGERPVFHCPTLWTWRVVWTRSNRP